MTFNSVMTLVIVGLAALGLYLISCAWWPFRNCGWCKGLGRVSRKDGKVWRNCWWCRGAGKRLRFGRWVWNWWSRKRKAAKR